MHYTFSYSPSPIMVFESTPGQDFFFSTKNKFHFSAYVDASQGGHLDTRKQILIFVFFWMIL